MKLKNVRNLPQEVIPALEKHTRILRDDLGEKLVGVYVHGSAAMGGFRISHSDLDYLAIVSDPLSAGERERLEKSFLAAFGEGVPRNGIEMSIVIERFAGVDFRYPTPYEFHFGTREQIRFHGSPHITELVDSDLAAHFTIVKNRGQCVFGKSIDEVFADVPAQYYLASIALDSDESFANIQQKTGAGRCRVPMYAVLNFCRVLAFVEQALITSKIEGAEWARRELSDRYHPVINAALKDYRSDGSSSQVDSQLLKDFASYANKRISAAVNDSRRVSKV